MSGLLTTKSAIAVAVQADDETRAAITTPDDLFPFANMRANPESFTLQNPEYRGTVHRPGDAILGRAANEVFDIIMRGPGGSSPPAANDYKPGRIIRAAGFEEIVEAAGIAAESLGGVSDNSGATTVVTLGASASAVDGDYVGYTIQFSDINGGSGVGSTSQIIAYDGTSKEATLGEKLSTLPAANYSLPPQLIYRVLEDFSQLYLTFDKWHDKKRYKHQHGIPGQMQIVFPTSNRGNTAIPLMTVGIQGDIDESDYDSDESAPIVPVGGAIAPFRDGKLVLNGVKVGGQSITYEHGIQVGFPPNPNKPSGNDAGCIVETVRSVAMNLNEILKADQDLSALANAQSQTPLMLQYGNVAGRTVYFCIPQGRLSYPQQDASGQFVTNNTNMVIDEAQSSACISFPYFI